MQEMQHTINTLLQLIDGHLVITMYLVKEALVALMQVQLRLITAPHGGPQFAWQGVLAGLQLTQQSWRDCDVVAPAKQDIPSHK